MTRVPVSNKWTRRRALSALGAAGATSLAAAAGIPRVFAQEKAPIKIGVVLPLSGAYAAQGTGAAQGIQLLAEQTNAKGGLLGRQVQVLVEDSQLKPQTAVVKATKLIQQDGCNFLMGEISGASTLALLEVAEREKIVMVTPYSSPEAVTGSRGTRYQFRTYSNAYIQAAIAVDTMIKVGGKKWGVLAADYAYGQDYASHLRRLIAQNGGQIVAEAFPALGTTDFVSHLQQASSGDPDVLWMVEYGRDATVALNQAVSLGLKKRMALGLAVANTEQVSGMQPGVFEGTFSFVTWYPNWSSPESKAFVKAYLDKHGGYSEAAGVHYIGAQVLFAAIGNAKGIESDPVIQALEGKEFDTIKGKIKLRAYDHQAVQTYFVGRGAVTSEFPVPIYEPVKTYAPDVVEKDFMPPPDPKVHPVRWRQGG
ncbi:MAG TPA: ABC transporter substrate-binding protein [Xanthobacteraceae bacterium]